MYRATELVRSPARGGKSSANGGTDISIVTQQAQAMTVAVPPGAQLLINACGRTVGVDMQNARSVSALQGALQMAMQMEGQTFNFFDVNGNSLATDADIHEAIANGQTPLCATLTDASIHFIENRREELAQMQWKLVRDQMTAATGKIAALARQINETQSQLQTFKSESSDHLKRVHEEALRAVESERDVAQCECRQLAERVNAVAQLVSSERQKRDVGLQGIEKQIGALRDMLDAERAARRQDLAMHMSMVNDTKTQIEAEKTAREALEDKHAFDIHTVMEKVEAFQRHFSEMFQDHSMEAAKTMETTNNQFQAHVRQISRVRGDTESTTQEMKVRFVQMEERCAALENRISDVSGRGAAGLDRLSERHERVAQVVESLRLEDKKTQGEVQAAQAKIKDLETSITQVENTSFEMVQKEREGRDDQFRRLQLGLHSTQKRQISELEEKIADRFERESSERERNVQTIIEDFGSRSPKVYPAARSISAGTGTAQAYATPTRVEVLTTSAISDSLASQVSPTPAVPVSTAFSASAPVAVAPPTIAMTSTTPVQRTSLGSASIAVGPYPGSPGVASVGIPMSPQLGTRLAIRPPDMSGMSNTQSSTASSRGPSLTLHAATTPIATSVRTQPRKAMSPGPMRQTTR